MFDRRTPTTFARLIEEGLLEIGDGYRAKNNELGGDGPIFLRAGHVRDSHIDFDGVERFRSERVPAVTSKMARPGDTIITTKGNSTGRTSFVDSEMPPFVYSPHLSYWRSRDPERLCPMFLRYWSKGPEFQEQLEGMKLSTDMAPYLSLTDQRRLRITLPSPCDQKAAGSLLGALDEKIALNRRMNRTLEAISGGLFKSWFVDFDPIAAKAEGRRALGVSAAVHALVSARFVESGEDLIPEGWSVGSVHNLAAFVNGRNFTSGASGDGRIVIRIAELNNGPGASTVHSNVPAPDEHVATPGALLFSWSGSLGIYRWSRNDALINQHIFKVICERYPQWFVHQQLSLALPFFQQIAAGKATTMGHIKREHLRQARVVLPPCDLIRAASPTFQPIYDRVLLNERESLTLGALRDALLPQVLSGAVRVSDVERTVSAMV